MHRLPFGILRDGEKPLLERVSVQYVTTPLEPAEWGSFESVGVTGPVIFQGATDDGVIAAIRRRRGGGAREKMAPSRFNWRRFVGLETNNTAREVVDIAPLMQNITGVEPRLHVGGKAGESQFRSIRRPVMLHIAGHGFYRPDPLRNEDASTVDPPRLDPMISSGVLLNRSEDGHPTAC